MGSDKMITQGKLYLGKCSYSGRGPKVNACYFTYELKETDLGPTFSAQAEVWNAPKTDIHMGGQCLDEVLKLSHSGSRKARRILEIWQKYHLNDMKTGLPIQEAAVRAWRANEQITGWDYEKACEMLRRINLYEVPVPEGAKALLGGFPPDVVSGKRGYRYGERWIYSPIPEDIIAEIKSWTI